MVELIALRGDITEQRVDAIVNAANRAMRGGGGVDGATHRAAGPGLLRECVERFPDGLATGDAGWTPGGELPARWAIHTVGPNFAAGERDRSLLVSCYRRALEVADELGARSVAFPLVSAGVYGWPVHEAAETAIDTILAAETSVEDVRLIAFDESKLTRLQAILWRHRPPAVAPGSIGALFDGGDPHPTPSASGQGMLRGDPSLQILLRGRFADTPAPDRPAQLLALLAAEFERITGAAFDARPAEGANPYLYVPELDPGHGMSAGGVNPRWWREIRIPSLLASR